MQDPRDFHPFTAPFERALALKHQIEQMQFQREAREHQRQQWMTELQNQKRQQTIQDFNTALLLHKAGAIPQGPNDQRAEAGVTSIFGPPTAESYRPAVTAPSGQGYYLPSEKDEAERGVREATAAGTAAGHKLQAQEDVYDPNEEIDLGERYGHRKIKIPRSKVADVITKLNPKWTMKESTNNTGDVTRVWYDDQGQEKNRVTEAGAGKSKTVARGAQSIPDFDARMKKRRDEWRGVDQNGKVIGGFYKSYGISQEVYDLAQSGQKVNPATGERYSADPAEVSRAVSMVQAAERELDKRVKESVQNEARGQTAQPKAASVQKPTAPDPRLKGKRFSKANAAVAASRLGMTEEEFSRWAHQSGATITP